MLPFKKERRAYKNIYIPGFAHLCKRNARRIILKLKNVLPAWSK
jgi:hypothetical protein